MVMPRRDVTHNLAKQAFSLRGVFPEVKADLKATRLIWTGPIQPTPNSRVYTVQITHRVGRFPQVRVVNPELETRPGEPLPHVYGDGTLCLHQEGEWTSDMLIVNTTLPWTAEWLINYEIWKGTGDWHGGGQWPPVRRPDAALESSISEEAKSPTGTVSERR
jgi:hypothetical protein